ncbi:MAG: CYTH domain-containing protein [Methylococcaceae bacterium]|nr:CYTH domain-containing protein [Methylococcaceae bacterium]
MCVEIERKFLPRSDGWRQLAHDAQRLRQGYLNNETRCSVRVRTSAEQAWLNIKSVTIGAMRQEFEYEIPLADAHKMLDTLSLKPSIEKVRYFVPVGKHVWEIDEFEGDNAGLIVAEIELEHPDEEFEKPDWLGEEVTDDVRYYNTSLCRHPYKDW